MKTQMRWAVLVWMQLTAWPAAAALLSNDDFDGREVLPSTESVTLAIPRPPTLSYEPLDPLRQYDWSGYHSQVSGSLWWEWTAPRDGWFTVRVADSNPGINVETQVYTGGTLERLMAVHNGNLNTTGPRHAVTFEAEQGRQYQIAARCSMDRKPGAGGTSAPGTLHLRPSSGPPANNTLAARAVLSGALPVTVHTTNLAPVTEEQRRVDVMTATFDTGYGFSYRWGPVLWWEWTCPEDGSYHFRTEGATSFIYIGRRRVTATGPAPAGEWESTGTPVARDGEFEATDGQVFDIAAAFVGNIYGQYGEYSLTLEHAEIPLPPNGTPETATPLPADVPFRLDEHWRGGMVPAGFEGTVQKYYRFTAPAEGYYRFRPWHAPPLVEDGRKAVLSDDFVHWFSAGGTALVRYEFVPDYDQRYVLDVSRADGLEGNDRLAAATDAGTAAEFTLRGHRNMAGMEAGEPAPFPGEGADPLTGSLWWRWTAPADGWLSRVWQDNNDSRLEAWLGDGTLAGLTNREMLEHQVRVDGGTVYYLRAGFRSDPNEAVCATELEFVPRPLHTSWQAALDLGTSRLPSWYQGYRGGGIWYDDVELWFRWTAAETIRAEFDNATMEYAAAVYTVPAAGVQMPLDPDSHTRLFTAGQTYWLRFNGFGSQDRWAMWEDELTAHGEPATALVLESTLPVAGAISLRGDVVSRGETALMPWTPDEWGPVALVWWKWQAPRTGTVRCQPFGTMAGLLDFSIYSGDTPDAQESTFRLNQDAYQDSYGYYLRAVQGRTYWMAALAQSPRAAYAITLELREVTEAGPPNDNFTGALEITDPEWNNYSDIYVGLTGIHRGSATFDPLFLKWLQASLEPGEPPVSLILGEEGETVPQTATTWWKWTPAASSTFKVMAFPTSEPGRSGGGDPGPVNDVTMDVYTGDSLATLHPVHLYESFVGRYIFRATAGTPYYIRVASGSERAYYRLQPLLPQMDEIFDYHAIGRLRFEDVGTAYDRITTGDAPNYIKLVFGMDYLLPFDHPANQAAAAGRLPRGAVTDGYAELRCRPDPRFLPGASVAYLPLVGHFSYDLTDWHYMPSYADEATGERYLRLDPAWLGGTRAFIRWDLRAIF